MQSNNKIPVRMKLLSTWEVDRTAPNCVPRLCTLTISRLMILKMLGTDVTSITISVRMQSSKRTLRSNELQLQVNGLLDTELELSFSLQYLHFIKRDGNCLHILLQRKNRYKNRTMLGYKTLAEGIIQMDQVLQKEFVDLELDLYGNYKDKNFSICPIGKIFLVQVASIPISQDHKSHFYLTDRSVIEDTDAEDDGDSSSGVDEEVDLYDADALRTKRNPRHNLKQRFVSLLRKFKLADSEGHRNTLDDTGEIQALFNELESYSCEDDDSNNDQDTMSISSTPKPCLRPFFSSSRSLAENTTKLSKICDESHVNDEKEKNHSGSDNNADQNLTDFEAHSDPQTNSPPRDKDYTDTKEWKSRLFKAPLSMSSNSIKKKSSCLSMDNTSNPNTTTIRKDFIEKVNAVFQYDGNTIPESIILVFGFEPNTSTLLANLESFYTILNPNSTAEIKFIFSSLFTKIYKFCNINNNNAKTTNLIKIILIGNDLLNNSCLRNYVELLSTRPADWQAFLQFFIVPLEANTISKYLAQIDYEYALLFPNEIYLRPDDFLISLNNYVHSNNGHSIQIPIAEALLTCQDESSQIFIPFLSDFRIGSNEIQMQSNVDCNDENVILSLQCGNLLSQSGQPSGQITPPSSPNIQSRDSNVCDPLELQLEYWPITKTDKTKIDSKISLKGIFRNIHVTRSLLNSTFIIRFSLKEKKQKIMRLGKKKEKEKDNDNKLQIVENISRLICSARTHNYGMKVMSDSKNNNQFSTLKNNKHLMEALKRYNFQHKFETSDNKCLISIHYEHFEPCLQNGPQCGLVVLAMLFSSADKSLIVDQLLSEARFAKFTLSGEMFSVHSMQLLATKFLTNFPTIFTFSGYFDCDTVRQHLSTGGLSLIPYDSDSNYEPCNRNGHKSHWALVCGLIIDQSTATNYVIARHGKTKRLNIWRLDQLAASNNQLNEISNSRLDHMKYIIPEGGINGENGLKNKAILLKK